MKHICGVWTRKNNCTSLLQDIIAATNSNNYCVWQNGQIGLIQKNLYNTSDSISGVFPFTQVSGNVCMVGDVRLDDTDNLINKLDLNLTQIYTDNELVLAAYRKWGQDCATHLLGDFAFAIWDGDKQELSCYRDHMGVTPLYYYNSEEQFIFATDIRDILAVSNVPHEVNKKWLSLFVVPDSYLLYNNETWFEGVYSFMGADVFTISDSGIRKRKYWTPQMPTHQPYKTHEACNEAFRDLFFTTVSERLKSDYPVTALLSGGLDSSAVVSVAAKILEKQNKEIDVFSVVLPNNADKLLTDERYYIDLYKDVSNVNIHYITTPDKSFFSVLDRQPEEMTTPYLTSRQYQYDAFVDEAAKLGSNRILDGVYGELGPTNHGIGVYAWMFTNFKWAALVKELIAAKKVRGVPIGMNVRNHLVRQFMSQDVIDKLRNRNNFEVPPEMMYIQQELADEYKREMYAHKAYIDQHKFKRQKHFRKFQLHKLHRLQNIRQGGFEFDNCRFNLPFLDKRIVEFGMQIPADLMIKNGYKRNMLREALDGILPKKIQWRNSKNPFAPDYMSKYNMHQEQIQDYLADIKINDPVRELINIELLKKWVQMPIAVDEKDIFKVKIVRDILPQAMYILHFLRRFDEYKV